MSVVMSDRRVKRDVGPLAYGSKGWEFESLRARFLMIKAAMVESSPSRPSCVSSVHVTVKRLISAGMLVGLGGAAALSRVPGTMLYGVSPLDTRTGA